MVWIGNIKFVAKRLRVVINFLNKGWEIPTFLAHKVLQRERRKRIKQP